MCLKSDYECRVLISDTFYKSIWGPENRLYNYVTVKVPKCDHFGAESNCLHLPNDSKDKLRTNLAYKEWFRTLSIIRPKPNDNSHHIERHYESTYF